MCECHTKFFFLVCILCRKWLVKKAKKKFGMKGVIEHPLSHDFCRRDLLVLRVGNVENKKVWTERGRQISLGERLFSRKPFSAAQSKCSHHYSLRLHFFQPLIFLENVCEHFRKNSQTRQILFTLKLCKPYTLRRVNTIKNATMHMKQNEIQTGVFNKVQ